MLYLVSHTHKADHCPAKEGLEAIKKFYEDLSEENAKTAGLRIVQSLIAPSEHTLFFVVKAKNFENVDQFFFRPLALRGEVRITPVIDFEGVKASIAARVPQPK